MKFTVDKTNKVTEVTMKDDVTKVTIIDFFYVIGVKDSANRMYNKMNLFIFYAEVQPVFVFATNISTLF